jgi:hypothetical protein
MVVPGTWIFPYEPPIQAAADRGLIITRHHVNTLGLDTYRWSKNKLYSFSSAPELLESAWNIAMRLLESAQRSDAGVAGQWAQAHRRPRHD